MTGSPLVVRVALWAGLYLAVYLAASFLDLWTTQEALLRPGVSEANVFATDAGRYDAEKARIITFAGALVMLACVVFSAVKAEKVAVVWLRQPVRSFARMYLLPWSSGVIDRSPLHTLSLAIAFVLVRLLAAGNNLILIGGGKGPLGVAVRWVGARTSAEIGLAVVMGGLYLALAIAISPLAARLIARTRSVPATQ